MEAEAFGGIGGHGQGDVCQCLAVPEGGGEVACLCELVEVRDALQRLAAGEGTAEVGVIGTAALRQGDALQCLAAVEGVVEAAHVGELVEVRHALQRLAVVEEVAEVGHYIRPARRQGDGGQRGAGPEQTAHVTYGGAAAHGAAQVSGDERGVLGVGIAPRRSQGVTQTV